MTYHPWDRLGTNTVKFSVWNTSVSEITALRARVKELEECLQQYVTEYEVWEKAVEEIIGRQPNTGVHLDRARKALKGGE